MEGYAIGMCNTAAACNDGGVAGKDFQLRCLYARAMSSERDVFSYDREKCKRVLFSPAGLKAYERCKRTVRAAP